MEKVEKEIINSKLNEILSDWCVDDKPDYVYLKCFNKPCFRYGLFINKNGNKEIKSSIEDCNVNYTNYNYIDFVKFIDEIHKNCDLYREFYTSNGDVGILFFYKNSITYVYEVSNSIKEIVILSDHEPKEWFEFLHTYKEENKQADSKFTYITRGKTGDFDNVILKVKHNLNVSLDNYNDDIPYDKMKEFCDSDSSGLMLLSGLAGTGKHFFKLILIIF